MLKEEGLEKAALPSKILSFVKSKSSKLISKVPEVRFMPKA